VRLWDVASHSCTTTRTDHKRIACSVAFCPKVRLFLMLSDLSDREWFL
jgi:hypothetical protein